MRLHVSTTLPCSAETALALVRRWSTLQFIAWPLVKIMPLRGEAFRDWAQGDEAFCRSYIFGLLPIGTRSVRFVTVDTDRIVTAETDALVKTWRHEISITPIDGHHCAYSDTVDIHAGVLTWPVWAWANWFYRHRQRRWQVLLRQIKGPPDGGP